MAIRGKVLALTVLGLFVLAALVAVALRLQDRARSPSWARSDPGGMSAVLACDNLREGVPILNDLIAKRAASAEQSFAPLPPLVPQQILGAHVFAKDASMQNGRYEPLLDLVTAVAYGGDNTAAVMNECNRLGV